MRWQESKFFQLGFIITCPLGIDYKGRLLRTSAVFGRFILRKATQMLNGRYMEEVEL